MFEGIACAEGIGIGNVMLVPEQNLTYKDIFIDNIKDEIQRYKKAATTFYMQTREMIQQIKGQLGASEIEILEAQLLMIKDPTYVEKIEDYIKKGKCAEIAVEYTCDYFTELFLSADDEMTNQRAADVRDIKCRMLKILLGVSDINLQDIPARTVIVANDLTPFMVSSINKENVVGIITQQGSKMSHAAILARAFEIPAILGVAQAMDLFRNGEIVILDGNTGEIIKNPSATELQMYMKKRSNLEYKKMKLSEFIGKPTITQDGYYITLDANIYNILEIPHVFKNDAKGIGLFRTEFIFKDNFTILSEEEQFKIYQKIAMEMQGKSSRIRLVEIKNKNIRSQEIKDIYMSQIRAIVRASAFGNLNILIPLVTSVEEVRGVKCIISQIKEELYKKEIPYSKEIKVGIIIETAAACLMADVLATEVDYFSIGTNDLIKSIMLIERKYNGLNNMNSLYNPAVIRAIKQIIESAKKTGIVVGMCGEAAADTLFIPLLLGLGLDEFSVGISSILNTRHIISSWNIEEAKKLVEEVMMLFTEEEVRECLKHYSK